MGVGSESTETLNSLVPKVLDIKGSGKSPYIGSTMTWFEYDDETQTYVDTGINAEGTDGKSAYEVAIENGFIGTVSDWLASLKGDTGTSGYTPVKGVDYFTSTDIASLGIGNKVDKVTGKGLSTNDLTATLKSNYDTAYTNNHTHTNKSILDATTASYTTTRNTKLIGIEAGAQVNQNAFSTVVAGSTSLVADSVSDTLTIRAGTNVTITGVASTDTMTISATDTTYENATTLVAGLLSTADKISLDSWSDVKSRFLTGNGTNAVKLNVSSNSANGSHTVAGGYDTNAAGNYSTVFGYSCSAALYGFAVGNACKAQTNIGAVAMGDQNTASGRGACAVGSETTASGAQSFTANYKTTASATYSSAFGNWTTASVTGGFAIGERTNANGLYAFAGGHKTEAYQYQTALGKFNVTSNGQTITSSTSGSPLVIGKGTSASALANCFRVETNGAVYATGNFNSTGADYAEYLEWLDGNPNNEDRRGLFVTLDGEHIRLANADDDYILGVISANPSVIGDSHEDQWGGMYMYDVYGSPILEWVEEPAVLDEDDNVIQDAYMIQTQKINPEYNPDIPYIPRSQRQEWAVVGMMGKLVVRDDGLCQPNGYCCVADGGIATVSDIGYRVLSRLDENHIKILIK